MPRPLPSTKRDLRSHFLPAGVLIITIYVLGLKVLARGGTGISGPRASTPVRLALLARALYPLKSARRSTHTSQRIAIQLSAQST